MSTAEDVTGGELREGYAEVGDQRLHYVEAGEGPLVVLLHGFPEFWYGWRLQIQPLAAAGFRVVAPDTRGINLSSKPDGVKAYDVGLLAADIRDLIRERGEQSALLAGHDWGGSIAWASAMNHPEVVERLATSGDSAIATSAKTWPSPSTTMCPTSTASSACPTPRTGSTTTNPSASTSCSPASSPPPRTDPGLRRGAPAGPGIAALPPAPAGVALTLGWVPRQAPAPGEHDNRRRRYRPRHAGAAIPAWAAGNASPPPAGHGSLAGHRHELQRNW